MERDMVITEEAIKEGFRTVSWPCRMEVLPGRPRIVCDGSHNPYSAAKLKATLPEYLDYSDVVMVAGVSADKNMDGIVAELAGMARMAVVARSRHPRAADAEEVAAAFRSERHGSCRGARCGPGLGTSKGDGRRRRHSAGHGVPFYSRGSKRGGPGNRAGALLVASRGEGRTRGDGWIGAEWWLLAWGQ